MTACPKKMRSKPSQSPNPNSPVLIHSQHCSRPSVMSRPVRVSAHRNITSTPGKSNLCRIIWIAPVGTSGLACAGSELALVAFPAEARCFDRLSQVIVTAYWPRRGVSLVELSVQPSWSRCPPANAATVFAGGLSPRLSQNEGASSGGLRTLWLTRRPSALNSAANFLNLILDVTAAPMGKVWR